MQIVITGANRGIGLCLCQHYAQDSTNKLTALCRKSSSELDKLNINKIVDLDVSNPDSIKKNLKHWEEPIDILINNAGVSNRESLDDMAFDTMEQQFKVNALGPLRIVNHLLPYIKASGKIIMITSRMGSIADNTSGSRYGYRMSKAALNIASVSLAHDLKNKKIAVGIIHPGYVKTDMTSFMGNVPPQEAAQSITQRIQELNLDNSGTFWHANGEVLPW